MCKEFEISCANKFCVYWLDDSCILNHVDLSPLAVCNNCILLNLNPQHIQEQREILLQKYALLDEK